MEFGRGVVVGIPGVVFGIPGVVFGIPGVVFGIPGVVFGLGVVVGIPGCECEGVVVEGVGDGFDDGRGGAGGVLGGVIVEGTVDACVRGDEGVGIEGIRADGKVGARVHLLPRDAHAHRVAVAERAMRVGVLAEVRRARDLVALLGGRVAGGGVQLRRHWSSGLQLLQR